jgi:hypothetical protein
MSSEEEQALLKWKEEEEVVKREETQTSDCRNQLNTNIFIHQKAPLDRSACFC